MLTSLATPLAAQNLHTGATLHANLGTAALVEHALAKGEGKWTAVAELYRDSFGSFPNVFGLLAKGAPDPVAFYRNHVNRLKLKGL